MKRAMSGLRAWLVQRASAVYMLAFILYLLAHFVLAPPRSYEDWRLWALSPAVALLASLFFAALFLHAWVGLRDVILDYVQSMPLRFAVLACLVLALSAGALSVLRILWLAPS